MNNFLAPLARSRRRLLAAVVLLGLLGAAAFLARPHLAAWYHFRAARSALDRYHNREAIQHLQICLKTWPADAEALLLAARIARRVGNYVEAEIALNKYQAQRGYDGAAALERILLHAESGEVDRAAGCCKYWIDQGHPDAPFIFEAMVRGYVHAYRLPEARRLLKHWRQTQPDDPQTYFVQGEIYDCEVLASEAITCYQQVLQIDPQHEEARLKLTADLLEQRAFADAVPHLEHLRQHQPDNLQALVRLAACRASLGQQDEAVRLLEVVLSRQPNFAPALAERGKIALADEEYAAAENWLRQAVVRNPSDQPARYSLVQCLRHMGKEEEAQLQEQQLHRLEVDLKRVGKIATRDMHQAPHNPALHCELGVLFLRNGLVDHGLQWLKSAVQKDARYTPAHQALADHYQRVGDAEHAEQHRRLAAAGSTPQVKSGPDHEKENFPRRLSLDPP
jgi:tetratricopeptide (TPR) repeat protein